MLRRPLESTQFISAAFLDLLRDHRNQIRTDGRSRWRDNAFVQRVWRSVKYEAV